MRAIEKKAGLILGGIFLFSLVLVGLVMAVAVETPATAKVTVNTFLSVTVTDTESNGIVFGSLNPNTFNNPDLAQDTAQTTPAVTVANDAVSNININVDVRGTDFVSTSDNTKIISVGQVTYDDDGAADEDSEVPLVETVLTTNYPVTPYYSAVVPGSSVGFWFFLDVPCGQAAASDYESTFSFEGNNA